MWPQPVAGGSSVCALNFLYQQLFRYLTLCCIIIQDGTWEYDANEDKSFVCCGYDGDDYKNKSIINVCGDQTQAKFNWRYDTRGGQRMYG